MKKLYLVFWWHMHQPSYRDALSGEYLLPWTYLHALKDYGEMPWLLSRFPGIKGNFNLVPVLLEALEDYASGEVRDPLLKILRQPVEDLSEEDRALLFTLIRLLPAPLKATLPALSELERRIPHLSGAELQDLRVLYLLVWCGRAFRERYPLVEDLRRKGKGYTPEELQALLEASFRFAGEIVAFYRDLEERGQGSLSVTPYHHPLLPLLLDVQAARENDPEVPLPDIGPFGDTAARQVLMAVESHCSRFGESPRFCWPAEGAVSEAALSLLAAHGLQGLATDETLLWAVRGGEDRSVLFRRYRMGESLILFRDRGLSDLIGFSYQHLSAEEAVDDFLRRLRDIYEGVNYSPLVSVILDGENCWEYYPENGYPFLTRLYQALEREPWIEPLSLKEAFLREDLPEAELKSLRAGSWMGGTFRKWLGHPEKNRAWELLWRVYRILENHAGQEEYLRALPYFLRAESSDWFWWYGEGLDTPLLDRFDLLFRHHLVRVLRELGEPLPDEVRG